MGKHWTNKLEMICTLSAEEPEIFEMSWLRSFHTYLIAGKKWKETTTEAKSTSLKC